MVGTAWDRIDRMPGSGSARSSPLSLGPSHLVVIESYYLQTWIPSVCLYPGRAIRYNHKQPSSIQAGEVHACHSTCVEGEGQFVGATFSFYHVDLRDSTQVVWFDHKHLYLLSLLRSPTTGISKLANTFWRGNGFFSLGRQDQNKNTYQNKQSSKKQNQKSKKSKPTTRGKLF